MVFLVFKKQSTYATNNQASGHFFVFFLPFLPKIQAQTQKILILTEQSQSLDLSNYLAFCSSISLDSTQSILERQDFQISPTQSFNFGYNLAYNWIRLEVEYVSNSSNTFYLFLDKPTVQYVQFALLENGQILEQDTVGMNFPYIQREYDKSFFHFPIKVQKGKKYTLLLCLRNHMDSLNASVRLMTEKEMHQFMDINLFMFAVLTALFAVAILISVGFLGFFAKKLNLYNYIAYPLYATTVLFHLASHEGIAYRWLWGESPLFALYSKSFFVMLGTVFFLWFIYAVVNDIVTLKPLFKKIFRQFLVAIGILFICFSLAYAYAILTEQNEFGRGVLRIFNTATATVCFLFIGFVVFTFIEAKNKTAKISALLLNVSVWAVAIQGIIVPLNNQINIINTASVVHRTLNWIGFSVDILGLLVLILYQIKLRYDRRVQETIDLKNELYEMREELHSSDERIGQMEEYRKTILEEKEALEGKLGLSEEEKRQMKAEYNQKLDEADQELKAEQESKQFLLKKVEILENKKELVEPSKKAYSVADLQKSYDFLHNFLLEKPKLSDKERCLSIFEQNRSVKEVLLDILATIAIQETAYSEDLKWFRKNFKEDEREKVLSQSIRVGLKNPNLYKPLPEFLNLLRFGLLCKALKKRKEESPVYPKDLRNWAIQFVGLRAGGNFDEQFKRYTSKPLQQYWESL